MMLGSGQNYTIVFVEGYNIEVVTANKSFLTIFLQIPQEIGLGRLDISWQVFLDYYITPLKKGREFSKF